MIDRILKTYGDVNTTANGHPPEKLLSCLIVVLNIVQVFAVCSALKLKGSKLMIRTTRLGVKREKATKKQFWWRPV